MFELIEKNVIGTTGGCILHVMKQSDHNFVDFGEVYCSEIKRGHERPWKLHKRMTLNLSVLLGEVVFNFTKDFVDFKEVVLSRSNYKTLKVEPQIWFKFRGIHDNNIIINFADIEHDESEVERKPSGDLL